MHDWIEPRRWSAADVAAWVQWARRQLQLPLVPMESFNVDGTILASFTEEDFLPSSSRGKFVEKIFFTISPL